MSLRRMLSIAEPLVARAAQRARSATVPSPVSRATVQPVAQAMATSSGSFAYLFPEIIRHNVDCEISVASANAR